MVTSLDIFRIVATEFSTINDATVTAWIDLTVPLVSRRRFGKVYEQALALLTAHRMKIANVNIIDGDDPISDIADIGIGNLMRVASYSEGEVSIGFNSNVAQYKDADAELALTAYGIQYLSLRRMMIVPIISAGEAHGWA